MLHVVQDLLDRPSLTPGYTLPWRSDETQHSPLAFVGRLQARIPRFEQARVTLEAERDRIRHRLEDAEVALAAAAAAARPYPGVGRNGPSQLPCARPSESQIKPGLIWVSWKCD